MDYSKLTPLLVVAIKELKAQKDSEIKGLEKENAALKEKLAETKGQLANFEKNQSDMKNRLTAMEALVSRLADLKGEAMK